MAEPLFKTKKNISEMLKLAQESVDPSATLAKCIHEDPRLSWILGYAIRPSVRISKFLPIGIPPYKPSDINIELAILCPLRVAKQLYVLLEPNVKQMKKEEMFIKWIECMHPVDVEIFVAIKDQELERLYPKLTKEVIGKSLGWNAQIDNILGEK